MSNCLLSNFFPFPYSFYDLEGWILCLLGCFYSLLKSIEKVIVFRCHPKDLAKRLSSKGWKKEKIKENIEAEMLDVILCEALEHHSKENVFEIDTTNKSIDEVTSSVVEIIENEFKNMKKYKIGNIDWSEEILRDF